MDEVFEDKISPDELEIEPDENEKDGTKDEKVDFDNEATEFKQDGTLLYQFKFDGIGMPDCCNSRSNSAFLSDSAAI